MNKKGFSVPIPTMITGIVSFFVAILAFRVFSPIIFTLVGMAWKDSQTYWALQIVIWLIMFFIVYIIVYGTLTRKTPDIFGNKSGGIK